MTGSTTKSAYGFGLCDWGVARFIFGPPFSAARPIPPDPGVLRCVSCVSSDEWSASSGTSGTEVRTSSGGGSGNGPSQMEPASQRVLSKPGVRDSVGQNISSRLLIGIFVNVEFLAVMFISSITVKAKSRFSGGSLAMSTDSLCRRAGDNGGAKFVNDGGFRI